MAGIDIPKRITRATELKWQKFWTDSQIYKFDFKSDKKVFSIDNPPPYASGSLHVGRATGYTLIDFIARYKRMRGYNVFFPLCFDVNGTPIEVAVEKKYCITKKNIDRHEFIKLCSAFADDNIARMTDEFLKLGMSMDASIYYRTDADYYRRITQISFIKLYKKGLIYRGEAPVNWCPRCITALADAEVEYHTRTTQLVYVKFKIEGSAEENYVTIATTRPELLCTCQLVAVHPLDSEKSNLIGHILKTPLFNRTVEVVADENVDMNFGTGVVMICSIGDKEDLNWIHKYNLKIEKGIDEEGCLTSLAGNYSGLKVEEARKKIISDLSAHNLIEKIEPLEQNVGVCWRCHTPVEFLQMKQWFLKNTAYKNDVLKIADQIKWYPDFMKVRLQEWVKSLSWDWVISRQRYFATPIPVWECTNCNEIIVAKEEQCYVEPTQEKPPVDICPKCAGKHFKGCEDVFDTWMDSSISPLFNTFWLRDEKIFSSLYPMSLRPQSHDIIRTWAYYTIIRSHLLTEKKPWDTIMIHGFIMAPDGRPMHTSLGNIIEPIPILDEYGADAFRYYTTTCTLGEDHRYIEKEVVHGARFVTKFWNVQRFIYNVCKNLRSKPVSPIGKISIMDNWILSKYSKTVKKATQYMDAYRFDRTIRLLEQFIWHELADHYLETVKYRIEKPDESLLYTLYTIGLGITKLLAPFLVYVTEEAYQKLYKKFEGEDSIHLTTWPSVDLAVDETSERIGELAKNVISTIRSWKASVKLPLSASIPQVELVGANALYLKDCKLAIKNTVHASKIAIRKEKKIKKIPVKAIPVYEKIGPAYKADAKQIVEYLKHTDVTTVFSNIQKNKLEIKLANGRKIKLPKEYVKFEFKSTVAGKEVIQLFTDDINILIRGLEHS